MPLLPERDRMLHTRRILLCTLLGGLTGCSAGPLLSKGAAMFLPTKRLERLILVAADDANGRTPVAVDLVFVQDDETAAALAATSAVEWFNARPQLQQQYLGKLIVHSWEIVPNTRIDAPIPIDGAAPAHTLLFALYGNAVKGRASLDGMIRARLDFQDSDFIVGAE
ncbi:hypothetical protein [Piscinibacter sp.]|uniref:hypothetical protein n=1 Tax=Piscinibacter sp. TaxID=1903157 RepID=UPI002C368B3F|nr:hypothetical protein [Albitalea sp.]HUG22186.1 hypothetical protein [Albitalea sp.]